MVKALRHTLFTASAIVTLPLTPALAHDHIEDVTTIESSAGTLHVETLAELEFPWGMDYLPDNRLLITEKPGRLRIYDGKFLSPPIAGVPKVAYRNQGGLLDVAVDPDFSANRMIYLYYVRADADQPVNATVDADPRLGPYVDKEDTNAKRGVVVRARMDGDRLSDVEEIFVQSEPVIGLGHFGGRLLFAPDGKLLITSGERQKFAPSQDPTSNLGKLIRINPDGSIPADNPFADQGAPLDAVWSLGHRNPLGIDAETETGTVWMQEMGPLYGDELNRIERAANYGWPTVSNGEHYNLVEIPHHETATEQYARPSFYWRPAISPSGLEIYTGEMFADWRGNFFLGGLSSQALIRVQLEDGVPISDERIAINRRIRDVQQASDGAILLLTDEEEGALLRLTPMRDASETDGIQDSEEE